MLVASLGLAACGGDDGDDNGGADAGGGDIDPAGTHTQYVVSGVELPTSNSAPDLGRDITGDGLSDNVLGGTIAALATLANLDLQTQVTESVNAGDIILLANVKATSLDNATGVGTWVFFGANADPAPPNHLEGDAAFDIAADSPTNAVLAGQVTGGQLTAGPGNVSLQIAISEGNPLRLNLKTAQVDASISSSALTSGRITGAITSDDIENEIVPAVATLLADLITADCTLGAPDCCEDPESAGAQILDLLDTDKDCQVPAEELLANDAVGGLLVPDVDLDGDGTEDALSIGIGFEAVGATFDPGVE